MMSFSVFHVGVDVHPYCRFVIGVYIIGHHL